MPEIKIKLDNDTYEKIKELAKKDERPVTQFTSRLLRNIAGTLPITSPYPNQINPYIVPTLITAPDTTLQPPFIPTANAIPGTSQSPSQLTVEQLREAGIKDFKLKKQLSPEEQQLQDLKLQQKTNNLLQQREKAWFKRTREIMSEYWNDAQCQYFAHSHIYGDAVYQAHPEDPNAVSPEENDNNLEILLKNELAQYEQKNDREEYPYQTEIEEKEAELKDPNNEYYQKVKKYCINNNFTESFYDILQYPSADNLKYNHDTMIYNAMRLPTDERNWDDKMWCDFCEYFK